jgi:ATP-dependent DNA helicase RecG
MQEKWVSNRAGDTPDALNTPVQFVKGVGPRRAELLKRLDLQTVEDLLFFVPSRYDDRTTRVAVNEAGPGEGVTLTGELQAVNWVSSRYGAPFFEAILSDGTGSITCRWFKAHYMKDLLHRGMSLRVYGKVKKQSRVLMLQHPEYEILEGEEESGGRILPVYPLTEALSQNILRKIIQHAVEGFVPLLEESLPEAVRHNMGYPGVQEAVREIHQPTSIDRAQLARERLAFEEFLAVQLILVARRKQTGLLIKPHRYEGEGALKGRLITHLPFTLTSAQKRVLQEIERDLFSPHPMHRLLQGDVGSGKTLVAVCAVLDAVESGLQAAFMAPTEILARQHAATLKKLLHREEVEIHLLVGDMRSSERAEVLSGLATGRIHLLVGTHAVISEEVRFKNLGLVVIDEQHKFGVSQRGSLYSKSQHPDVLVMTATPIPRTLAMTLYGDLDVSVMNEMPGGRKPIVTRVIPEDKLEEAYGFIVQQVQKGRQAYVVYPRVEEGGELDLKSAREMYKVLTQTVFRDCRVGLIHGRLKREEKERVMNGFRRGDLDVLIATTVIEVGVDVPNATVMLVEHADRYGLAQLHQLRGRIGRGSLKSFCILQGTPRSKDAWRRLKIMEETTDGFRIAEEDLDIRGMGNVMGAEQSGLPRFRVGNLMIDGQLLQQARETAEEILTKDLKLKDSDHRILKERAKELYRQSSSFVKVG